jgi:hypothetical protein
MDAARKAQQLYNIDYVTMRLYVTNQSTESDPKPKPRVTAAASLPEVRVG